MTEVEAVQRGPVERVFEEDGGIATGGIERHFGEGKRGWVEGYLVESDT